MTVGGNHNYKEKVSVSRAKSKLCKTMNIMSTYQPSYRKSTLNSNPTKDDKLSDSTSFMGGTSLGVPFSGVKSSEKRYNHAKPFRNG